LEKIDRSVRREVLEPKSPWKVGRIRLAGRNFLDVLKPLEQGYRGGQLEGRGRPEASKNAA